MKSLARRNPMVGVSILLNLGLAVLLFLILDADKDAPRIPARTVIESSEQRVTLPPPPPPLLAHRASPSPQPIRLIPNPSLPQKPSRRRPNLEFRLSMAVCCCASWKPGMAPVLKSPGLRRKARETPSTGFSLDVTA